MIYINIKKKGKYIQTIEAVGHSGYAERGKDIVCSAVSTLMQSLILGLEKVLKVNPSVEMDENVPIIKVETNLDIDEDTQSHVQVLMKTARLGLKDIADSYPKFIKIKEM